MQGKLYAVGAQLLMTLSSSRTFPRFCYSREGACSGGTMPDIIQEAWRSVAECTLLAQEARDAKARQFFLNLASSWKKVALNYEVLAQNDPHLIELKRTHEAELTVRPAEDRLPARDPVRPKKSARFTAASIWRRLSALAPARRVASIPRA